MRATGTLEKRTQMSTQSRGQKGKTALRIIHRGEKNGGKDKKPSRNLDYPVAGMRTTLRSTWNDLKIVIGLTET